MAYHKRKKGMEGETLVKILAVSFSLIILLGISFRALAKADDKAVEEACKFSNLARYAVQQGMGETTSKVFNTPRACKTIQKQKPLPSKDFASTPGGPSIGARYEVREMIANCWDMWLEGNHKNMFQKGPAATQGCFSCYTFSVSKEAAFGYTDLLLALQSPYRAADTSDRCAGGGGGYCRASCASAPPELGTAKPTSSSKCAPGLSCCISDKPNNECINKGGTCAPTPALTGHKPYVRWKCDTGTCFVKDDKFATYIDYVQGSNGVGSGPGMLMLEDNIEFKPEQLYAVTLISPDPDVSANTAIGATATLAGAAVTYGGAALIGTGVLVSLTGAGLAIGIPQIIAGVKIMIVGVATTGGGAYYTSQLSGKANDINYIYVSKYDSLVSKCAVDMGAA
jgi:hypothetical protein